MACFHPIDAYQCVIGKRRLKFGGVKPPGFVEIKIPCLQCVGCRLERSRQWAVRCMHEASLYKHNCFITLTYDDEHLPKGGSLEKKIAFPRFMKRLRKRFPNERPRYFHCGEYGERFGRPHYHALLFNFHFPDKELWSVRGGSSVFRSPTLEALWPMGQSEIGSVSFESAAYVARYSMKKVNGPMAFEHYKVVDVETGEVTHREPEYATMSLKPGIGAKWYEKYKYDVYPADRVVMRGAEMKPPRYYDKLYELEPNGFDVWRERRRARRAEDESPEKLAVREECTIARLERAERSLEQ